MPTFRFIRVIASRIIDLTLGPAGLFKRLAGWRIGRRRGWTPDTRRYGAGPGYEIRYAGRTYWWDGERLTPIIEK
jgi:hypothetical protein